MGAGAAAAAAPMGMKGKARSMAAPVMSKLSMPRQEEADRSRADDKTTTGSFAGVPPAEAAVDEPAASYDGRSLDQDDAEELNGPADRLSTRTGGIAPPARRSAPESKRDEGAPPPPPKAQKKEGLVDLARRLLKPFSGEAQKDETPKIPAPGRAPAPAAPEPAPAATRRLNGKVRRQGRRLIIEIDVTSLIKWAPGSEARLELSNGTIVKAPVLMAMTTAEGEYGLGLIITLVLEVDERVGAPATIHLSNGNEVLEIVL
jgi:hypothetical protein